MYGSFADAPDARAKAHYHKGIETIGDLFEGECVVHYGPRLEHHKSVKRGEQIYIAADVPHARSNESGAPCTWIVTLREVIKMESSCFRTSIVYCPRRLATLADGDQRVHR